MTSTIRYADFGSISHGTLRTEDLLQEFACELAYQLGRQPTRFARAEYRKLVREGHAMADAPTDSDRWEYAEDVLAKLQDALDAFAPPYGYFGTLEGDGADFGYWLSPDAIDEFDGLKVGGLEDLPAGFRGECMVISDHGNVTFGVVNSRGQFRQIWAVV